jgi:hypothetical protein
MEHAAPHVCSSAGSAQKVFHGCLATLVFQCIRWFVSHSTVGNRHVTQSYGGYSADALFVSGAIIRYKLWSSVRDKMLPVWYRLKIKLPFCYYTIVGLHGSERRLLVPNRVLSRIRKFLVRIIVHESQSTKAFPVTCDDSPPNNCLKALAKATARQRKLLKKRSRGAYGFSC